MSKWSKEEEAFLIKNYPLKGKRYCAEKLGRCINSIRSKTHRLGLKLDTNSEFYREFQKRAAKSKIGKKRPRHSKRMKEKIKNGEMPHIFNMSKDTKKKIGLASKKRIEEKGHPKGMLGKKHSEETKKKFSKRDVWWHKKTEKEKQEIIDKTLESKRRNGNRNNHIQSSNAHSRAKSGKRKDLGGEFFRSGTEANFARYLKFKGIKYEYEKETFFFEGYKRGTRSYTPDFYIGKEDKWYEVKGWLDSKSKTKLKRMKKHYPQEFEKLYIVKQGLGKKSYQELLKLGFTKERIIDRKKIENMKDGIINRE